MSFNFQKEEILLFSISILVSLYLHFSQKKQIASYCESDSSKNFYFAYKNGFGFASYTKRPISGGSEVKIKRKTFTQIKNNLTQRGI